MYRDSIIAGPGYALANNTEYYVVFDIGVEPHEYYISEDGSNPLEKRLKLPVDIWFYRIGAADPVEFASDTACFKSTGALDETNNETSVYLADGDDDATAQYSKTITVERTTGRVEVSD